MKQIRMAALLLGATVSLHAVTYDLVGSGQYLTVAYGDTANISGTFSGITNNGFVNVIGDMTVNGDVDNTYGFDFENATVHITGGYTQTGNGTGDTPQTQVNAGAVTIDGAVALGGASDDNRMTFNIEPGGVLSVGALSVTGSQYASFWRGTLDVREDMTIVIAGYLYADPTSDAQLRFSGSGTQLLTVNHTSAFVKNVHFANTAGSVSFADAVDIRGNVTAETGAKVGDLHLAYSSSATLASDLTIDGDLVNEGLLNLGTAGLNVNGNVSNSYGFDFENATVHITGDYTQTGNVAGDTPQTQVNAGTVTIDGTAALGGASDDNRMTFNIEPNGVLSVGTLSVTGSQYASFWRGTLDVKGNMTLVISSYLYNDILSEAELRLSGTDTQQIAFNNTGSRAKNLVITNHSAGGVVFNDGFDVTNVTYESCSKVTNLNLLNISGTISESACTRPGMAPILMYLLN